MDFTYIVAAFLSLVIGFCSAAVFVAVRGRSSRKLIWIAAAVSVVSDFTLLIDWRGIGDMTPGMLIADLGFFILYAFIGCAFGAYPVLAVRNLLRRARRAGADQPVP